MARRVLILGSDPTLLETRREILKTNGIEAETLLGQSDLEEVVKSNPPALLVACSSLDLIARRRVLNLAHHSPAKIKCLVIGPRIDFGRHSSDPVAEEELVLGAFDGPESFFRRVSRLIAD